MHTAPCGAVRFAWVKDERAELWRQAVRGTALSGHAQSEFVMPLDV